VESGRCSVQTQQHFCEQKLSAKKAKIETVPTPYDDSNKENADNVTKIMDDDTQNVCDEKEIDLLKENWEEEDETIVSGYCTFCEDNPCMWLDMRAYNDDEHGHLPLEDWPPQHNVDRFKST
jgi:hypothetical protein